MDFELSEDQEQLRDSVRAVLDAECPPSVVRAFFEGRVVPEGERLWHTISELDWPAVCVPEALGGLGLGFVELALIAEEMGRRCVPVPFLSTAAQFVPLVLEAAAPEQQKQLLSPVMAGTGTGTVAVAEDRAGWDLQRMETVARRSRGGEWVIEGRKAFVFDGQRAETTLVVARGAPGRGATGGSHEDIGVFALPAGAFEARPTELIDPSQPLAEIELDGVTVAPDSVLVEPGDPRGPLAVRRALEQATAALAVALTGTCRTIFEVTLQYTKDRQQFGRPIGSFQAIKHRLVDMFLSLERASSLAYFAALTIAEDDPRRSVAVSMAKAAAGDCQRLVVQDGLQLHGGIGFMWEQNLHLYLKRAKSSDLLFGGAASHRAAVARALGLVA